MKDIDASKAFYIDVLGFAEHTDITLADGSYRWCTVKHPIQPELQVHLTVPGPTISTEMVTAINRDLDEGAMLVSAWTWTTAVRPTTICGPKVWNYSNSRGTPLWPGGRRMRQLGQLDGAGGAACVHQRTSPDHQRADTGGGSAADRAPTTGDHGEPVRGQFPHGLRASGSLGTSISARIMNVRNSSRKRRRNSAVLTSVTSPASVNRPDVKWTYASGWLICGELQ